MFSDFVCVCVCVSVRIKLKAYNINHKVISYGKLVNLQNDQNYIESDE